MLAGQMPRAAGAQNWLTGTDAVYPGSFGRLLDDAMVAPWQPLAACNGPEMSADAGAGYAIPRAESSVIWIFKSNEYCGRRFGGVQSAPFDLDIGVRIHDRACRGDTNTI
jgi:hypothetical protein